MKAEYCTENVESGWTSRFARISSAPAPAQIAAESTYTIRFVRATFTPVASAARSSSRIETSAIPNPLRNSKAVPINVAATIVSPTQ